MQSSDINSANPFTKLLKEVAVSDLPEEVLLKIFAYLSHYDICQNIRNVSYTWNILSYSSVLWKSLDVKREWTMISNSFVNDTNVVMSFIENMLKPISDHVVNLKFEEDIDWLDFQRQHISLRNVRQLKVVNSSRLMNFEEISQTIAAFPSLRELYLINSVNYFDAPLDLMFINDMDVIEISSPYELISDDGQKNEKIQDLLKSLSNVKRIGIDIINNESVKILLDSCRQLRHLSLAGSIDVGLEGFEEMPKFDSLISLNIDYTFINDACLKIIVQNTSNLKYLSAQKCDYITDVGFSHVGRCCGQLESLTISKEAYSSEGNLTNIGLEHIAKGCPHLKVLVAKNCQGIDDVGLKSIAQYCQNMETLKVAGCIGISDTGVEAIANGCQYLRHVNMNKCVKITHKSVSQLIGNCIWLHTVKFDGCSFISNLELNSFCHLSVTSNTRSGSMNGEESKPEALRKSESFLNNQTITDQFDIEQENKNVTNDCQGRLNLDTFFVQTRDLDMQDVKNGRSSDQNNVRETNVVVEQILTDCAAKNNPVDQTGTYSCKDMCKSRIQRHSHVRKISLKFCSNFGDHSLKQVSDYCPDLQEVFLTGTCKINDATVEYLLKKCYNLKILDLSGGSTLGTSNLTDNVLISVGTFGTNVEELFMCRNFNITKAGVEKLLCINRRLKIFVLTVGFDNNTNYGISLTECKDLVAEMDISPRKMKVYAIKSRQGATVQITFSG